MEKLTHPSDGEKDKKNILMLSNWKPFIEKVDIYGGLKEANMTAVINCLFFIDTLCDKSTHIHVKIIKLQSSSLCCELIIPYT